MHWKSGRRTAVVSSTMTTTNDGSILLTLTKWADEGHYLRDFLQKYQLPQVARIIKGQYLTLGVPTIAAPSLQQQVFLCSTGKRLKVAAQCVKFKEGKKVVPVGPKLAIPENYEGWFEILSEEGRAVRCVEGVAELARCFPDSCLVREHIKAYVAKGDDVETITDKVRTIAAGETLVLISEVLGTSANPKPDTKGGRAPGRFLRCFDERGDNVYLGFEQRAKFSIIAKEGNISGVHSIKNLLTKRLPLMVRLVTGKPPVGGKAASTFVPEMRLYASFEEECVMALPLHREPSMVAVPTTAPLKLQGPKNAALLQTAKEYSRLEEKCRALVDEIQDRIQVFDVMLSRELPLSRKLPYFRRAFSDPYGYRGGGIGSVLEIKQEMPDKEDPRYDEIDQIYDYVRGFAPPPKLAPDNPEVPDTVVADKPNPPNPPPIETIPARRASNNNPDVVQVALAPPAATTPIITHCMIPAVVHIKRATENVYERIPRKEAGQGRFYVHTRASKNKMYVKSAALHRGGSGAPKSRFFRHRGGGAGGHKDSAPKSTVRSVKSSATSPIFNIRYKSLTNLALDFNTLDSSNSGGATSAGSGGSYIMEDNNKCSKGRLARPKSLTNLVWDLNNMENNHTNILNSAICRLDPRRLSNESARSVSKESEQGIIAPLVLPRTTKRIGTLYL